MASQPDPSVEKSSETQHVESVKLEEGGSKPSSRSGPVYGIDEAHQKRVIRRVDLRLLPILGVMYSISLIDRTNLGLALVAGMQEDLGLDVGARYTIIVMVFFVAYIRRSELAGIPWRQFWSHLNRHGVYTELGDNDNLQSLTGNNGSRFPSRMHLSDHLLVYSIRSRKKVSRFLADVSRIFIIEGAITCGVCLFGWFIIIDFPTKADKFLKPEEKQFIIDRINYDRGDAEEDPMTLERILHHLKDWKLYFWAFNLMASTLPGYAFSYFKTIVLKEGMGWSTTTSQLLSAPPYVFAAAITYFSGWLTDKYRIRGPIIAVHQLLTCIGMVIMAYGGANGARYFGIFLGVGALQYCIPGVLAFQANNITSHSKRGVASATCLIGGGLGGIIASVAFKSSESPQYTTGIWVTFGISIVSIIMTAIMDVYFIRMNRRAREGGLQLEGMSDWYYTL
ncbi:major facilitator superfamily domain-containing protein [Aspergillus floccosus]